MALLFLTVWFCGCAHGGFAWGVALTASQIVVFMTHKWGLLTKTNSSDATPTRHQAVRPSCVLLLPEPRPLSESPEYRGVAFSLHHLLTERDAAFLAAPSFSPLRQLTTLA